MSKFIKLIPVAILLTIVACRICGCGLPLYQIYFDQLFYDDQDVLVVGYRAFENNPDNITKFAKFNTDTYKWEASDVAKKVIVDEEITTAKGKTIVKNGDGAVVFEQPFPSISDIENQTDILLPNPHVYYEYFKSGKNYLWGRKTIVINVGINKKVDDDGYYNFSNIQSFLAEYDAINSLWNIKHLKEIAAERERYYDGSNVLDTIGQQFFVNLDISLCHRQVSDDESAYIYNNSLKCLVKYDDGETSLQKLYGEIMPAEYSGTIKKIYDSTDFPRVYFDKNQNLYAFYNNTDEAKGKYFYFEMYKPDNPTVAQHKQKIYW
ncbi:MAG: hypothetical protein P8J25_06555 [Porticoccaceae bacterium]|nr:hypothetical protein [Porticoccaceae bacterium]